MKVEAGCESLRCAGRTRRCAALRPRSQGGASGRLSPGWSCSAASPSCSASGFFLWLLPNEEVALDRNADGIVVLTGGTSRVTDALELLAAGRGKRLLITGVNPGTTTADIAHQSADYEPLPGLLRRSRLFRDQHARQCGARHAAGRSTASFHSLIVVTSAYHMPRALAEIAHQLPDVDAHPVSGRLRPPARSSRGGRTATPRGWCCRNISNIFSPRCACASTWWRRRPAAAVSPTRAHAAAALQLNRTGLLSSLFAIAARSLLFNALFYLNMIVRMIVGAADARAAAIVPAAASCAPMRAAVSGCCGRSAASRSNGAAAKSFPPGACIVACKHQSLWETFALFALLPRSDLRAQARTDVDSAVRLARHQSAA